jgi:hypothetical protein
MMWEGMVDEALALVQAIDDRYDGALHNPWNEVECGDHYSRAMAAWGVYQAACGFHYDGPRGVLGMDPRLNADDFAAFFTGAEGWGLIKQRRTATEQTNTIAVRWGTLSLSEVLVRLPEAFRAASLKVALNGKPITAMFQSQPPVPSATFERVQIDAGGSIECRWTL